MQESQAVNNIVFPVSLLYIQLDTNIGTNEEKNTETADNKSAIDNKRNIQLFKRSMIKMPKMDVQPVLKSEYPFFTKNVRYPSSIERETWKTKYEFFFNRELFVDRLRREIDNNPDIYREHLRSKDKMESAELYKWMQDTEKRNIMITLRALFPIPEVFGKTLKNSFDHILSAGFNSRVFWDVNIKSAANIFGFMYKFGIASKEKDQYFINIGGKQYEVDDVVWENDLINHPVYRKFLGSQRETYEEVARSATEVKDKYDVFIEKLDNELTNMRKNEPLQKDFYLYSINISSIKNKINKKMTNAKSELPTQYQFLKLANLNINEYIKGASKNYNKINHGGHFNIQVLYLIHKHIYNSYYDDYTTNTDDGGAFIDAYDEIDKNVNEPHNARKSIVSTKVITENQETILEGLLETEFLNLYELVKDKYTDPLEFENYIINDFVSRLKSDTIMMLKDHIFEKNENQTPGSRTTMYGSNSTADRRVLVNSVVNKLDTLSGETGENAANLILSIKEDFDNHKQLYANEGINVFMERDYEFLFERLLKNAIEIKATSIVLRFATQNIPMNLTGKKPDGTDVSPVNQRINKYIMEFFGTEASINNKLSTNVNAVFEPVRKTSNMELYKVLKLFKFGDEITKREFKLSNVEIEKYREVLDNVYLNYISLQNSNINQSEINEYLYTGVDEVKSAASTTAESNPEPEIRRIVQEIYVRMDLVDADKLEKTSRSSCKLFDKELEQEFLYLADPRNKNNMSLSRFRNLDFDSVVSNPMNVSAAAELKPTAKHNKTGGKWSRRIRDKYMNSTTRKCR